MKLTFYSSGSQRDLGSFSTKEDAEKEIRNFLNNHNYTPYYWRVVEGKNKLTYDVGSWSQFFIVYFDDNAELEEPFENE